jgi:hypothetical protein
MSSGRIYWNGLISVAANLPPRAVLDAILLNELDRICSERLKRLQSYGIMISMISMIIMVKEVCQWVNRLQLLRLDKS